MTVFFSKKCELGIQSVLFLSTYPNKTLFNSGEISEKLKAPKEFISKILQTLTLSGIVGSKKGKSGGFFLQRDPSEIRIIDIIEAIDGLDSFKRCLLGFEGCSVDEPCPVHDKWGKLRNETFSILSSETLSDLRDITKNKLNSLKLV
jgi:Rrf2 family protein